MVGFSGGIGGTVGGTPYGGGPATTRGGAAADGRSQAQRELERLRRQNSGQDFAYLTQNAGVAGNQRALPALDFEWLGHSADLKQLYWKLTINSLRAGLEMQRGRLELAHTRMSSSDLISHCEDELILPWQTVKQTDAAVGWQNVRMCWAAFEGRAVMAPLLGNTTQYTYVFAETSTSDPTVKLVATVSIGQLYSMSVVRINGDDNLVLCGSNGAMFVSALDPWTVVVAGKTFEDDAGLAGDDNFGLQGGVGIGGTLGPGQGLSTPGGGDDDGGEGTRWIATSIIQSPEPGGSLIVRSGSNVILTPIEPAPDLDPPETDLYDRRGTLVLQGIGLSPTLGYQAPLGFGKIRNLPPAAYYLEWYGFPGGIKTAITSVNGIGHSYTEHHVGATPIIGATLIRERGIIGLTTGFRVLAWDGKEEDLRIFADEAPVDGRRLYCTGLYSYEGQLFADVMDLPYTTGGTATGVIRFQRRRYDFELRAWSPTSVWVDVVENGAINFQSGYASPSTSGYISAFGQTDLPVGPVTRNLHNYALAPVANASAPFTWYHKYEQPAANNPYSERGGDHNYDPQGGTTRSPGYIFPPGYEYVDKYIDSVETGLQDTGGAGSSFTIRIGEMGRLDSQYKPLHRTFTSPVNHESRRQDWPENQTALLFPQIEFEIARGVSNQTLQALPVTIYGHVDLPDAVPVPPRQRARRSAG